MKQTPNERCGDLSIALSKTREALRDNAAARRKLRDETGQSIDLKPYRVRYLSGNVTDDPDCSIVWLGWLHAVEVCEIWDDIEPDDSKGPRALAILMDERKALKAAESRICNRLRIIGDQLRKAEP